MALVDADSKFIWADIGGRGSAWNAQIYSASGLRNIRQNGNLGFPDADPFPKLSKDNQDLP